MVTALTPLATAEDFREFGSNEELVQNEQRWSPERLDRHMLRATRAIESRCERRLAPFTGLVQSVRAEGVDIEQIGADTMPLDLQGAIGRSDSQAYGVVNLVRDFWLDEYAPQYPELWTSTIESVQIFRFWGDNQFVSIPSLQGPEVDGHYRVQLGTFLPIGSTVVTTYSGGYTVEVPDDLNQACIYQAMKMILVGNEPYGRAEMSLSDLDSELLLSLVPYIRY